MNKNEIFNYAKKNYNNSLFNIKNTSLRVVEKIIRNICIMDIPEESKKETLLNILLKIEGSTAKRIMGAQTWELKAIIRSVFNVSPEGFNNTVLSQMDMSQILYYYCVYERMIESKIDFS